MWLIVFRLRSLPLGTLIQIEHIYIHIAYYNGAEKMDTELVTYLNALYAVGMQRVTEHG